MPRLARFAIAAAALLAFDLLAGTARSGPLPPIIPTTGNDSGVSTEISRSAAVDKARKRIPEGAVTRVGLEIVQGRRSWTVDIRDNSGSVHEVLIDANNGQVRVRASDPIDLDAFH